MVNNSKISDLTINSYELNHLLKYNFVISNCGFVCVTDELWIALMNSEENQKIMKQFRGDNINDSRY